jgi:hypothetical protein
MNTLKIMKWAGISLLAWGAYWTVKTFAVSEETQMLRVQTSFIEALENRKWSKIETMVCADYMDEWGQDKAMVQETMKQLLGGFFFLSIEPRVLSSPVVTGTGYVMTTLKLEGNGAGISGMVMTEANRVKEPWLFHWHKRGFWPWSWELVQMHNDGVNYGRGGLQQ